MYKFREGHITMGKACSLATVPNARGKTHFAQKKEDIFHGSLTADAWQHRQAMVNGPPGIEKESSIWR